MSCNRNKKKNSDDLCCFTVKLCDSPPDVPNSMFRFSKSQSLSQDGQSVYYECHAGFQLADPKSSHLICSDGEWEGNVPSCGKFYLDLFAGKNGSLTFYF